MVTQVFKRTRPQDQGFQEFLIAMDSTLEQTIDTVNS